MPCVRDIMTVQAVSVSMDETLEDVRAIFDVRGFHHLIVVDRDQVVGVISDRDLYKHVSPFIGKRHMERDQDTNTLRKRAHQIMTRKPVTVTPEMDVHAAAQTLLSERVSCLPVVDDAGHLAGIVTWRDLLKNCVACDAIRAACHHADALVPVGPSRSDAVGATFLSPGPDDIPVVRGRTDGLANVQQT